MNQDRYKSFLFATGALLGSGDLDPLYPFLRGLLGRLGSTDPDVYLWFVQLYHAFYRVDTAWKQWFHMMPTRGDFNPKDADRLRGLPIATERRNLRQHSHLVEHLTELKKADLQWWESRTRVRLWEPVPWQGVYDATMELKHNGPWAAFKWTDLARYVLGWDLTPTPPSVASGAGPAQGLALLETTLDGLAQQLEVDGIRLPWDQVETALCKWHGACTGRYKIGQDLEELKKHCALYPELAATYDRTHFSLPMPAGIT